MKIPRQITICGRIWKVKRIKDLEFEPGSGDTVAGLMLPDLREIHIDAGLKGEDASVAFLHEFNHAIFAEIGVHTADLSPILEEIIVENIARQYANAFSLTIKPQKKRS